jgi:hypothetical protein
LHDVSLSPSNARAMQHVAHPRRQKFTTTTARVAPASVSHCTPRAYMESRSKRRSHPRLAITRKILRETPTHLRAANGGAREARFSAVVSRVAQVDRTRRRAAEHVQSLRSTAFTPSARPLSAVCSHLQPRAAQSRSYSARHRNCGSTRSCTWCSLRAPTMASMSSGANGVFRKCHCSVCSIVRLRPSAAS